MSKSLIQLNHLPLKTGLHAHLLFVIGWTVGLVIPRIKGGFLTVQRESLLCVACGCRSLGAAGARRRRQVKRTSEA
jgi:hypothetical protein